MAERRHRELSIPERIVLVGSLLVAAVPRLLAADWQFYNMDEATTAIVARVILEGGIPYRDVADQRGPVAYSVVALIFRLAGTYNMVAVHVAQAGLVAFLTLLLYRVAASQGRRSGLGAAALFAVTSYFSPATDFLAFHVEWCLILFSLSGVLLLWRGLEQEQTAWLMPAGAAFALAGLSKQPALADFILLLPWAVLVHAGAPRFSVRRGVRAAVALLGGFGAVAVVYLAGVFLAGALDEFVFNYWTYNTRYFLAAIPASQRLLDFLTLQTRYLGRYLPLLVLFAVGFTLRVRAWRRDGCPRGGKGLLPFAPFVWAFSSYTGAMWSGRDSGHYFIQLLPSACWVGGHTLTVLLDRTSNKLRDARRASLWRTAVAATLGIAMVVPVAAPNSAARSLGYRLLGGVGQDCTLRGAADVAGWLRQQPDQGSIFVWGFLPEIYVLADRAPASSFILCNPLSGMIPWVEARAVVPSAWETFQSEMVRRPARYIVDTSPGDFRMYGDLPPESAPIMRTLLAQRYHLAATISDQGHPAFRIFELAEEGHAHGAPGDGVSENDPGAEGKRRPLH